MKTCTVPVLLALVPSLAQIDTPACPYASDLGPSGATGSCRNISESPLSTSQTFPCLNKLGLVPVPHCHKGSFSLVEVDNFIQPLHHVLPLPSRVTVNLFPAFGLIIPDQVTESIHSIHLVPLSARFSHCREFAK